MTNLKKVIEEIEEFGNFYKKTNDKTIKGIYDNRVESIILDKEKSKICKHCKTILQAIYEIPNAKCTNKNNHPTKQTVQTGSGDEPLVCENELSGSQRGVKTDDNNQDAKYTEREIKESKYTSQFISRKTV